MKTVNKFSVAGVLILLVPILLSFSPVNQGDQILGMWLTSNGKAKIQIYRSGLQYFGRLVEGLTCMSRTEKRLKRM